MQDDGACGAPSSMDTQLKRVASDPRAQSWDQEQPMRVVRLTRRKFRHRFRPIPLQVARSSSEIEGGGGGMSTTRQGGFAGHQMQVYMWLRGAHEQGGEYL